MELTIIEDTVWTDFYTTAYDAYLASLKSVIRKGRPHPIIDARTRLAAHRRGNLQLLGLKRVAKLIPSAEEIKRRYETDEASTNGADEGKENNE